MGMLEPKFPATTSVIIPVYNAAPYLEEAVESVIRERDQGVKEIILVEDGSRDDGLIVARELAQKHGDLVQLFRHPQGENRGAGASRNLGIQNSRGEYICFLDADDFWLPGRLNEAISMLEKDFSLDGVYSPAKYRFEDRTEVERFKHMPPLQGTQKEIDPCRLFIEAMNGMTIFHTNGFIVRKRSLEKMKWFDENLPRGQDVELTLRMAAVLKLAGTPSKKPVAVIRRHGANRWNPDQHEEELQVGLAVFRSLYEWSLNSGISTKYKRYITKRYFFLLGRKEQFKRAWQIAWLARKPWLVSYAWRYRVPGPRTVRWFFRNVIGRGI